jgi:hypothetical protein
VSTQEQYERGPARQDVSGWAVGGVTFAATMMILIGFFQAIAGIVAIANDDFYVVKAHYTFDLDATGWGWIHLIIGILVLLCGFSLFARRPWAGVATIMLASLSAVANFFFIPYYPIWSLVVIGLDIWVIWAITRPGVIRT